MKKQSDRNDFRKVCKDIEGHMKDPKYVEALNEFIRLSTS
jgi:hypothetical protein